MTRLCDRYIILLVRVTELSFASNFDMYDILQKVASALSVSFEDQAIEEAGQSEMCGL